MNDRQLTTDERRRIRARKLLDTWFLLTVVVLIALVAMGGWLAYEPLANPGTEERETVVGSFEEQGSFSHQAEIQQSTSLFEEGETVRNRPLYYTQIAPEVDGTYNYEYRANDGELDVVMDAHVLVRAVDDDGDEYWQRTEPLERHEAEAVPPEERVSITYTLNVPDVLEQIEAIEDELGASAGETESKVIVETTTTGTVNGQEQTNRHTAEFALDASSGTYSIGTEVTGLAEEELVETTQAEREYTPLRSYGPLGLAAFGLVGLVGLGTQRARGKLKPTDEELLALAATQQREEFADWISTGRFPESEIDGARITVDSLEDIVDVAIDCDSRVIEDSGAYYVPGPGVYYAYRPGGFGSDDAGAGSVRRPATLTHEEQAETLDGESENAAPEQGEESSQANAGDPSAVGNSPGGEEREVDADGGRPMFDE